VLKNVFKVPQDMWKRFSDAEFTNFKRHKHLLIRHAGGLKTLHSELLDASFLI